MFLLCEQDVVLNGSCSLECIVELVLAWREASKSDDERLLQVVKQSFFKQQLLYAGLDVIKPLHMKSSPSCRIYCSGLTQRMPCLDSIHLLTSSRRILEMINAMLSKVTTVLGTWQHELQLVRLLIMTRRSQIQQTLLLCTSSQTPKTRVVNVAEVLAPLLIIPGHFVGIRARTRDQLAFVTFLVLVKCPSGFYCLW